MSVVAVKGVARVIDVDFGRSHAGLSTVVHKLINPDGSLTPAPAHDWSTAGVVDLGDGQYGITQTFATLWSGRIKWDTALGAGNTASEDILVIDPATTGDLAGVAANVTAIKYQTDRLGAGIIGALSPVLSGGRLELVPGDDYATADNRAPVWEIDPSWPSLTGATGALVIEDALTAAATINTTAGTITVPLTAAQTTALEEADQYSWALTAALASGRRVTLAMGVVTVREKVGVPA